MVLSIVLILGVLQFHLLSAPRPKAQQPAGHQPRNQPSDSTRFTFYHRIFLLSDNISVAYLYSTCIQQSLHNCGIQRTTVRLMIFLPVFVLPIPTNMKKF